MIDFFVFASTDVLLAMGALISDCAGVMAVFIEGFINLGAFLCYAFSIFSGNVYIGIILAICTCVILILVLAIITETFFAQPFVVGLALNLFSMGFIAFFSTLWFNTKGPLSPLSQKEMYFFARYGSTILACLLLVCLIFTLQKTRWGMHIRLAGSDAQLLTQRGMSPKKYRIISWCTAAFLAALVGCILSVRLQAFVPNVSAGKGWLALVTVFFGKKKTLSTLFAALFFAAVTYGANRLQALHIVPHAVLLAFPNVAALLLFVALPQKKKKY